MTYRTRRTSGPSGFARHLSASGVTKLCCSRSGMLSYLRPAVCDQPYIAPAIELLFAMTSTLRTSEGIPRFHRAASVWRSGVSPTPSAVITFLRFGKLERARGLKPRPPTGKAAAAQVARLYCNWQNGGHIYPVLTLKRRMTAVMTSLCEDKDRYPARR